MQQMRIFTAFDDPTYWCGAIFQDDNARPHRARVVTDFFRQHNVNRMDWPPYSLKRTCYGGKTNKTCRIWLSGDKIHLL